MKKVYAAENMIDAQLLCDQLIDSNIAAKVHGGYLSGAAGEIPVDNLITVWIQDEDRYEQAKTLVTRFEKQRNQTPSKLICKSCGEESESYFSLCWSCGSALTE